MYTFFILILFIPILHTATRSEYGLQKFGKLSKLARFSRFSRLNDFGRLGRASGEPKIFATCIDKLGCVDTNEKWYDSHYRPINIEPLDRHTIRTEFLLMKASTNGSKDIVYDILTLKPQSVDISGFKKGKKTFFLIHDFTSNGHTGWIKHVAIAITEEMDGNIISVDWEAGAEPPFDQAISNARVVALEMEVFLKMLTDKFSIKLNEIHIIGHGVGAHIAGYVGKNVRGIGRITGLDPTGPRFENMPSLVRLDPDDARYVEVLHTEAFNHRSQGTLEPMGHSDFYLNNAAHQPGCSENSSLPKLTDITRTEIREGKILPACSHKRAFKYYISAITTRECKFVGIACNSYTSFLNGSCSDCDNNMCATFDLCPPPTNVYKTRFFLNTHAESPFCMHAYQINISIESNENSKKADGYFEFILIDINNKITFAVDSDIGSIKRTFIPGVTYTLIIYAPPPAITDMKEAKVRWRSSVIFPFPKRPIYVKYISVRRIPMMGENLPTNGMCPESGQTEIRDSAYIQFVSCDVAKIEEEQRIAALTTTQATTSKSTMTTAGITGTTQLTTVINTTWTLANSTTTTPKPPIQCLTPGTAPTATPKPNVDAAGQVGASGMNAEAFPSGVQTVCYTIVVPENVTTKPEDLTNLVVFDKEANKTTISLTQSATITTTSSLSSSTTTAAQSSGVSTLSTEIEEEEEEKEKQTTEVAITAASIHTTTIAEEELENPEAQTSVSPTSLEEEIENEAVVTNINTGEVEITSTLGIVAPTEPVSNLSVTPTEITLGTALPISTFAPTEARLQTTHGIVETAIIFNPSTSPEVALEATEAFPVVTPVISISLPPTAHTEMTSNVIESEGNTTVTSEGIVTTQQELIISSNVPTLPGELETVHEAIEATQETQNLAVTAEEVAATTEEVVVTEQVAMTTHEISPAVNISEPGTDIMESTVIAEHIGSETKLEEIETATQFISTVSNLETMEMPLAAKTEENLEETTVLHTVEEIVMTSKAVESEDEENMEAQEEIPSSVQPSQEGGPNKGSDSKLLEGEFGATKLGQSGRNDTHMTFTLNQPTTEEKAKVQESTEQIVSAETGTCTEWNVTELVTGPAEKELTYIMHFTQENIASTEEKDEYGRKQVGKSGGEQKEVFLAGKVISLNGSDVDVPQVKQSSTYPTKIEQSTDTTTSAVVRTTEETTEFAKVATTTEETERTTKETAATTTTKPTESQTTTSTKQTETTTTASTKQTETTTIASTKQTETTTTESTTQTKLTTHTTTKPTATTHHSSTTKSTSTIHTTHKTSKHPSTTKHTTAKATTKVGHTKTKSTTECITTELPECDEVEE